MKRQGLTPVLVASVLITITVAGLIGGFLLLKDNRGSLELTDEQLIRAEFEKTVDEAPEGQRRKLEEIEIEGNWAIVGYSGIYIETGEPVPAGPGLMIFKKENGQWHGADGEEPNFSEWLEAIPESLIPQETKDLLTP